MAPKLIAENVYWVGAVDYDRRQFHGLSTPHGSSYNAYLVVGLQMLDGGLDVKLAPGAREKARCREFAQELASHVRARSATDGHAVPATAPSTGSVQAG
ncbi:MAG: hypothetical protein HYY01_01410 [Chloroflexi bacterium]|nr:hypothetical protein [Chloroflexota bacterium]